MNNLTRLEYVVFLFDLSFVECVLTKVNGENAKLIQIFCIRAYHHFQIFF